MSGRWPSLLVVVASMTCYHISQRSMPADIRPAPLFTFVYSAAALVMLVVLGVIGPTSDLRAIPTSVTHWAPWLLVASVTGIELGVFAMYRTGWSVSTANTATTAIVAAILVIVGVVRFGEHITPTRLMGLGLCVVGAGMVAAR